MMGERGKTVSTFQPITPAQVAERLLTLDKVAVLMHQHPDGDTVGSAMALCHILKALGKTAVGVCADKIPERLSFLTEGMEVYSELPQAFDQLVAVDVATPLQLGRLQMLPDTVGVQLMIDHHDIGASFADYCTEPQAAAAGEIVFLVAEALLAQGKLKQIPVAAKNALYAAMTSDTGCFRYSNTTARTLRIAAQLLEDGQIDSADITHRLFETKSPRQLKAEAFAIEQTVTSLDGRLAWVKVTQADKTRLGVEDEHLDTVIDMVRTRDGVEVALAVREVAPGQYKASMRSTGFDVAAAAACFGGGGHVRAAGCTLLGEDIDKATEPLLTLLQQRMANA